MNARILRKWGLQKFVMSSQWITVLTILVVIFVDKCEATIDNKNNNRRIEYPNMRPFRRKPPSLGVVGEDSASASTSAAAAYSSVPNFHSQISLNNNNNNNNNRHHHFNLNDNNNDNINYDKSLIRKTSLTSSANIDINNMMEPRTAFLNIPPTTAFNHDSHVNLHLHPLITKLSPVNDITLNYNYNGPESESDFESKSKFESESESDNYRFRRNSYSSYHQRRLHHQQQQQQIRQQQHHNQRQLNFRNNRRPQRRRRGRYCSARDPEQLAFEAPTVFEGKLISMSFDRRANFSISFEVLHEFKTQKGYILPRQVRLQFSYLNGSGECDIYREYLKPRGLVRVNDLEQGRLYYLFVRQIDLANFTILGQPIRKTRHTTEKLLRGVSNQYAQTASITSLTLVNKTIHSGRKVRILCKVSGQPTPKITWFKDNKSINRDKHLYSFNHTRRKSELTILSFNSSDAGTYECRAKNKAGTSPVRRQIVIETPLTPLPTKGPMEDGEPCNPAMSRMCLNGATCRYMKTLRVPFCQCADGFIGERCSEKEWEIMPTSPTGYRAEGIWSLQSHG
ncbi:NRG2 family protein [Megaselia abdita]